MNAVRRTAAVLAACLGLALTGPAIGAPAPSGPVLEIPVILSLTGSGAFLGSEEADSIRLVEQATNASGGIAGRPVKFTIGDDQSSPQVALQLFSAIMAKQPNIVIGSSLVAACSALAPLVTKGPVVYCLSAGMHPAAGTYMFAYGISTDELIRVELGYFKSRGWTRIAGLFPTDASGQDGERSMDSVLARRGFDQFHLVAREHFVASDLSVAAQVSRIKAAAPQAALFWGTGPPLGTALRSAKDVGLDVPIAVSPSNLNYTVMKQFADFLPRELYMGTVPGVAPQMVAPGPLKDAASSYYDAIKASGRQPDANMVIGWDSASIVVGALRALGPSATPEQLRAYIAGLHGWYGAAGQYDFRDGSQRGLTGSTALVVRYDAAQHVFVPVSRIGGAAISLR